jgi:hypothetical protein
MTELVIGLVALAAFANGCEAWAWKRRAREWQRTAKATATLCEQVIALHAPGDDELLEARAELRRIREGVRS